MNKISQDRQNFAEKLNNQITEWYKQAESKAQIVMSLITSFVILLSSLIFTNTSEVQKLIKYFDRITSITLLMSIFFISLGLICMYMCLKSRLTVSDTNTKKCNTDCYTSDKMYFFGDHARHEPEILYKSLHQLTEEKILDIYAFQIIAISRNVRSKHLYLNYGFICVVISVLMLIVALLSFLYNLQNNKPATSLLYQIIPV